METEWNLPAADLSDDLNILG